MKTKIILIALLSMLLVSPAYAFLNGPTADADASANASANASATANPDVDVDVDVDPYIKAYGGDARAYGGDADVNLGQDNSGFGNIGNRNFSPSAEANAPTFNTNKQAQGQLQGQMQGQSTININKDLVDIEVDTTPIGDGLKAQAEADLAIAVEEGKAQAAAQSQAEAFAAEENAKDRKAAKEAAHAGRDFAEAGQLVTGGQADYRGPFDDAGPTVLSVFDIMEYQNVFLWKHLKPGKLGFKFGEGVRVKFRTSGLKADRSNSVTYMKEKPNGARFVGFMYAWATGDEADTMLVMQKAARDAMEAGATVAVVISEGHTTHTETFGWGIGVSGVTSTMSGSGKTGSTGHMGTGINKAKAGPEHKPYVQLALFVTE